jgi:hypothetical protein
MYHPLRVTMNFRRILAAALLAFSVSLVVGCSDSKPSPNSPPGDPQKQKGKAGTRTGPSAPPPIEPVK